jgi:hypothetical protein
VIENGLGVQAPGFTAQARKATAITVGLKTLKTPFFSGF